MPATVQPDSLIRWRYRLLLANDEVFETHAEAGGDWLQLGQGHIHPNLEAVLPGLLEGEARRFTFTASEAFGLPDPEAIQSLPLEQFALLPEPGQILSFTLPSGAEVPGRILAIQADKVQVDFNHPLAGHNITLEVEIMAIMPRSE